MCSFLLKLSNYTKMDAKETNMSQNVIKGELKNIYVQTC